MSEPNNSQSITVPKGFRAAGVVCGIKQSGSPDLAMIIADQPCTAAGLFTQNAFTGAPVQVAKSHLSEGR